jgi:Spy/CpxP family protein refolding chaperone
MEERMRKLSALVIAGMLAGAALANPTVCAARSWHYGWWQRGPHGHWGWRGGWGPGGRWMRMGPRWVYRYR